MTKNVYVRVYKYNILLQLKVCPKYLCLSTVGYRSDLFLRDPNKVFITDFFGSQKRIENAAEPILLPHIEFEEDRYVKSKVLELYTFFLFNVFYVSITDQFSTMSTDQHFTIQIPFHHYMFTVKLCKYISFLSSVNKFGLIVTIYFL